MSTSDETGPEDQQLSALELTILANLDKTTDTKVFSDIMKVDPQVIAEKFDKLRAEGYVTPSKLLTEKGYDCLRQARQQGKLRLLRGGETEGQPHGPGGTVDELSSLDHTLLRNLAEGKSEKAMSRTTGVDRKVVNQKLDQLYALGYITENSKLSAKGFDAISQAQMKPPTEERQTPPTFGERFVPSMRVTIAAVFMAAYGAFGIGLGVLVMFASLVLGGLVSLIPSGQFSYLSLSGLLLGGIFLVMGIAGIVAGWSLWRGQKWGLYLSIVLLVIGIAFVTPTLFFTAPGSRVLVSDELAGIVLVGNCLIAILVLSGWNRLVN